MTKNTCTLPIFGPRDTTAFDIRGIRFLVPPADDNPGGGGGGGDDKKFTQEELDQQIEQRLARERKKFEGHDDLKAKAEQWDAYEAEKAKNDAKNDKGTDDKAGDDKQVGPTDADVQKRIDDALAAERVRSGSKLVSLALDKALADRSVEPSKLLDFDRKAYVTAEGDVDTQKLDDWVKENTTDGPAPQRRRDPSQGGRDASANGGSVQSGRDAYAERHNKSKK